jgi:ankyrin repeat protein
MLTRVLAAIAEGHGDTAMVLLKAGAETDKKDNNGALALDLAPDAKVMFQQCHHKISC